MNVSAPTRNAATTAPIIGAIISKAEQDGGNAATMSSDSPLITFRKRAAHHTVYQWICGKQEDQGHLPGQTNVTIPNAIPVMPRNTRDHQFVASAILIYWPFSDSGLPDTRL
jgi:hypothetical protein